MRASTLRAGPPIFHAMTALWRQWRKRMKARAELAALGSAADNIARDLNLSGAELVRLANRPSSSAALLDERMQLLGLRPERIRQSLPAVLHDLQRTCSSCALKRRCKHDLHSDGGAEAVAAYCPNEGTLEALRDAPSAAT